MLLGWVGLQRRLMSGSGRGHGMVLLWVRFLLLNTWFLPFLPRSVDVAAGGIFCRCFYLVLNKIKEEATANIIQTGCKKDTFLVMMTKHWKRHLEMWRNLHPWRVLRFIWRRPWAARLSLKSVTFYRSTVKLFLTFLVCHHLTFCGGDQGSRTSAAQSFPCWWGRTKFVAKAVRLELGICSGVFSSSGTRNAF